jgi:hypothetical protein
MQSIALRGKIPLSCIISDPRVRAAFKRAERDLGGALLVPQDGPPRVLPSFGATIISKRELVAQD